VAKKKNSGMAKLMNCPPMAKTGLKRGKKKRVQKGHHAKKY
jgi:hypothetical protein